MRILQTLKLGYHSWEVREAIDEAKIADCESSGTGSSPDLQTGLDKVAKLFQAQRLKLALMGLKPHVFGAKRGPFSCVQGRL